MKLSTAITKGSKGRAQTQRALIDNKGYVCALGAACLGIGFTPAVDSIASTKLRKIFPALRRTFIYGQTLEGKIVALNDDKCWSFKQITYWLRRKGL